MAITRRDFLKWSGAAGVAGAAMCLGIDLGPLETHAAQLSILTAKVTTTVCPYCAVGCGLMVHTEKSTGRVLNTEGDPDHPINQGALCAKGAALYQMTVNPNRLTRVLYRAPYSEKWEAKTWDWALAKIAERVQTTRDADFTAKNAKGQAVNRTTAIAHVGSAALDNEECWVLQAIMRSLGLVYIEHQARI